MTERNHVDLSIDFFESYVSNSDYNIGEFSIDEKYVKAIFLGELYNLNSKKFVEKISNSTKEKIDLQTNIHDGTISDKKNELENHELIGNVAERTVYLLLCSSIEVPAFILSNWDMDPDKQIYYSRSQSQTGLRNWVYELITVLSPLSQYYDTIEEFVHDVGFCAHCSLLDTAPTGARYTADWTYPRSNIPQGPGFMDRIKQIENPTYRFHKHNPTELIESFYSCFENFINLASHLGYCSSKQQVAIDTTYIPTGADAPEALTTDGSSSSRTSEKYGERRWIYQIATTITYPSKFILSVEPIYDLTRKHLRLEPQLQQLSDFDVDVDTVICDASYYEKKSIRKLRDNREDWIVRAEVRGESDISQLVDEVEESGQPESKLGVGIGRPPLTPKPDAVAYPNVENDTNLTASEVQTVFADPANPDSTNDGDRVMFTDNDPDKETLAYVVGGAVDDTAKRKTQVAYRTRKRIESMFGQIKDNGLVDTESHDPAVRYYTMAMGCMFYNFHYLINRTLSPQYGIPIRNTSMQEWLTAIRDVAFSD